MSKKAAALNKGLIFTCAVLSFKRFPHFLKCILLMWNLSLNDLVPFTERLQQTIIFTQQCSQQFVFFPFPVLTRKHAPTLKASSINKRFYPVSAKVWWKTWTRRRGCFSSWLGLMPAVKIIWVQCLGVTVDKAYVIFAAQSTELHSCWIDSAGRCHHQPHSLYIR